MSLQQHELPADAGLNELIDAFIQHTIGYWKEIDQGTSKRANKHSIADWHAYQHILGYGDVGRERLVALFKHPHKGVRCSAACRMLRYAYDEARPILEEIEQEGSLIASEARCCMENWDKGIWNLDLPPDSTLPRP